MRPIAFALTAVLIAASPALANEKATPPPPPTVLMSPIALPVIRDGRLVNYFYVTMRLNLSPGADSGKMREKEPFFRDAILRGAYRTSIVRADDPNVLDLPRFTALVVKETNGVAGGKAISSIRILKQQPQRYLPKAQPASAAKVSGRPID
ncbi:MAG: hypothetical protein ACXW3D_10070 [Caulobacteraceae bacterium]